MYDGSAYDILGALQLVVYLCVLAAYIGAFRWEQLRFMKQNKLINFPNLPLLGVIILYVPVIACTWARDVEVVISEISVSSFVMEMIWLYSVCYFLIQLLKFSNQHQRKHLFLLASCTLGPLLILSLCFFGLFPIEKIQGNSSVQGYVEFLRISLYCNFCIHMILFVILYYPFIKKHTVLWSLCALALILTIVCASLYSVFPIQELHIFVTTLWLMIVIIHGFIITDFTRRIYK
eukprot:NODE_52_length_30984_cov_1.383358.p21 type:complete len:234 gc:universal NODE_52_length_30984_cov_1.383358:8633-9334(+)